MKDQAMLAARRFFHHQGYNTDTIENWSKDGFNGLYIPDEPGIIFCNVVMLEEDKTFSSKPKISREEFEKIATWYLKKHSEDTPTDYPIRFDEIQIKPVAEHKALLRHHVSILSIGVDFNE